MLIRFAQTNWHTLMDIFHPKPTFDGHIKATIRARKDLSDKLMAAVHRAVDAEILRMEMDAEKLKNYNGRVVLSVDIKIEAEGFPSDPPRQNLALIAELDDILNKTRKAKNLLEY